MQLLWYRIQDAGQTPTAKPFKVLSSVFKAYKLLFSNDFFIFYRNACSARPIPGIHSTEQAPQSVNLDDSEDEGAHQQMSPEISSPNVSGTQLDNSHSSPAVPRSLKTSKELALFNALYCLHNGYEFLDDYHFIELLKSHSPGYIMPTVESLKSEYQKRSLFRAKKFLGETEYVPYIFIVHKQHRDMELLLGLSFNKKNEFFYINANAVPSNDVQLIAQLNDFVEESIQIVNKYMEKQRGNLYRKVEFVIVDSSRRDFKSTVALRYGARSMIDQLSNHNCGETMRLFDTPEILTRETSYLVKFKKDLDNLIQEQKHLTLIDFDAKMLHLLATYCDKGSEILRKEYEPLFTKLLNPIGLVGNVLHPEHIGRLFWNKVCAPRRAAVDFFCKRFPGKLDPITKFTKKIGIFAKYFNTDGKLTIGYKEFWPQYRLDFEDLSLFAEAILSIPSCLPDINLSDICLASVDENNFPTEDEQREALLLLRFLKVEKYSKKSAQKPTAPGA